MIFECVIGLLFSTNFNTFGNTKFVGNHASFVVDHVLGVLATGLIGLGNIIPEQFIIAIPGHEVHVGSLVGADKDVVGVSNFPCIFGQLPLEVVAVFCKLHAANQPVHVLFKGG